MRRSRVPPRLLAIAGSDSGGGAGIQADLKTFAAFGGFGMTAVTAVTAQNTCGVAAIQLVKPTLVERQVAMVATDIGVDAAKVGMLGSAAIVRAVARAIRRFRIRPLVVDPVMASGSGEPLADRAAVGALARELLPLAALITPNLPEAEVLCGRRVRSLREMERAAVDLGEVTGAAVLVKGGHRRGEPIDVLWDGSALLRLRGKRLRTPAAHGTGCTLAAAVTALLAWGEGLEPAVRRAKSHVEGALAAAPGFGRGSGPLQHLWNVRSAWPRDRRRPRRAPAK